MEWDLSEMIALFRRLTAIRGTNDLSDTQVAQRIEDFYVNRLPQRVNVEEIEDFYYLYTLPNIEIYAPLPNDYILRGSAYINGREIKVHENEMDFFAFQPPPFKIQENVGTGDGGTTNFTGTLTDFPLSSTSIFIDDDFEVFRPKKLLITSITQATNAVITTDDTHSLPTGSKIMVMGVNVGMTEINGRYSALTSLSATTFSLDDVDSSEFSDYLSGGEINYLDNVTLESTLKGSGTINMQTGVFDITFASAPADAQDIEASYEAFSTSQPDRILVTGQKILARPIPDDVYEVKIPVVLSPKKFTQSGGAYSSDNVLIRNDWARYVIYGAAIETLKEKNQHDLAERHEPTFLELEQGLRSRRIRQLNNSRSIPTF